MTFDDYNFHHSNYKNIQSFIVTYFTMVFI
ncbi:unnamed protein product [Acanthoscelides obtectus]|uniref:Uncharacterized protein n=1 Tax=Acanthoscelides obtectus TaxID=200917 RepID=A0A9P0LAZ9_ACAOB|nr:unnamed protein product [Acanthoscelides obtectus]CAK1644124.1 hypothetical protein AOBTE_LOCUS13842 [Acanthoscelides obtectus]